MKIRNTFFFTNRKKSQIRNLLYNTGPESILIVLGVIPEFRISVQSFIGFEVASHVLAMLLAMPLGASISATYAACC